MKEKIELEKAKGLADAVVAGLKPFCDRIEIAGSIRRRVAMVGDIEVVCIPTEVKTGLFDDEPERHPEFVKKVESWEAVKGKPTGKYTQRIIDGVKLDLFMVEAGNFGLQLAIRTGPARYSHKELASRWASRGWKSVGGYLQHTSTKERMGFSEERALYSWLGINWVEPARRK